MLAVTAVAVLVFMRDRPGDVGLLPYGDTVAPAIPTGAVLSPIAALRAARHVPDVLGPVRHLLRLWGQHQRSHPDPFHFALRRLRHRFGAAPLALLAAIGVFDFFGTIASGWLSDRYDNRWLLFWYYGLRGLSLLFLPFTNFSFYGLSLFAHLLWPRLGRDGSAHREADGRTVRARAGQSRVSAGCSPGTSSVPPSRPSGPASHGPPSRAICPLSSLPACSASSPLRLP